MVDNSLYSMRTTSEGIRVIKFDMGLNVIATYIIRIKQRGRFKTCSCPRGRWSTCRHRTMLDIFFLSRRVDTGWFYNFNQQRWLPPLVKRVLKTGG